MKTTMLCCLVFVMTLVNVQCVPLEFTTSRYNEETLKLHNTKFTHLANKITKQVPQIYDMSIFSPLVDRPIMISSRRSKAPTTSQFYLEESMRNLRNTNFNDNDNQSRNSTKFISDSRKLKNKTSSLLYSNFIRNNVSTQKPSNKTLIMYPTQASSIVQKKTTNSTQLYGNFIKNTLRDTQTLKPVLSKHPNRTYSNNSSTITTRKRPSIITTQKPTYDLKNKNQALDEPSIFKIKLQQLTKPIKMLNITRKPIVFRLTKIPVVKKATSVTKIPIRKSTKTPGWISKIKSTTYSPSTSTQKVKYSMNTPRWPNRHIINNNALTRYKNYTDKGSSATLSTKPNSKKKIVNSISHKPKEKLKPSGVKYVPKPGYRPSIEEIKQNWYESGVPYPNPMPEISSNLPVAPSGNSHSSSPPLENLPAVDDPESIQVEAIDQNSFSNPISTFNLDMRPSNTGLKDSYDGGVVGDGCPTVHISSSVLSPQQRQACSDLNLVINSHFHQNSGSDRTPSVDTYQAADPDDSIPVDAAADPAADPVADVADAGVGQADEGIPLADSGVPQADPVSELGSGGTGGSGASGGSGGDGGDGDDGGGLRLPDLKGILDLLDWLGNKLGGLFNIFKNPYLYILPATLFFLVGFILVLALFPWWVPLLFLLVGLKSKHKPNILHHKHVHKAVHHPDGWFWNQNTKTWENIQDYLHRKRIDNLSLSHIPRAIDHFGKKYSVDTTSKKFSKKNR